MTTIVYTDPHLGLNRVKNTTPASRARLRQAIFEAAADVAFTDGCDKICCGDLFDSYSNPEEIIEQGAAICASTEIMLSGNHDVTARSDKMGSLELLAAQFGNRIIQAEFGNTCVHTLHRNHHLYTAVPHVTTQALFEQSLDNAIEQVKGYARGGSQKLFLLVHCNYESPFADTETTLNLTEARADHLLEFFDYILMGHEHQPRDLFGGRLLIIGNVHPTGFADISDKFVVVIADDGTVTREKIWDAKEHYLQVDVNNLDTADVVDTQFLRITGEIAFQDMAGVSKHVAKLWKEHESLFAIKIDATLQSEADEIKAHDVGTFDSLPAQIERELEGTKMLEFWKEFRT